MDGSRYAFKEKDGKEIRHNVNRLWKHQPWDSWHPDTGKVVQCSKEEVPPVKKTVSGLKEGEVIVFAKEMSDADPLPWEELWSFRGTG